MKANDYNYFQDGKCYQWNERKTVFSISKTKLDENLKFSLDKNSMERFLYFAESHPEITIDKTLIVKSGAVKAQLKLCNTTLVKPNGEDLIDFEINLKDLKTAAKYCSQDNKKPVLCGVHINETSIVATDSFKAFRKECGMIAPGINITIDKAFIDYLPNAEVVKARYNKNSIWILADDVVYIGRLIEGSYPDVSKLYKAEGTILEYDKELLSKALMFGASNDRIKIENKKITLYSQDTIEFENDVELNEVINLNCKNFKTVVDSIETDKIQILVSSAIRPIIINGDYIVLPIRVEGE